MGGGLRKRALVGRTFQDGGSRIATGRWILLHVILHFWKRRRGGEGGRRIKLEKEGLYADNYQTYLQLSRCDAIERQLVTWKASTGRNSTRIR